MKACHHPSFKWVHDEDLGDRTVKHYRCRACGHPMKRNVKKPRYVAREKTFTKKPPPVPKLSKTLQKAPVRQRKAIPKVSAKRKNWLKQYEAKKKADGEFVTAWDLTPTGHVCVIRMFIKDLLHPHHPLGRVACRILFYRWVTPTLHDWIHKRAAWARAQGFILPEMSGRESGPEQADPFGILPAYREYVEEHGLH